jgi:hypothetical protein
MANVSEPLENFPKPAERAMEAAQGAMQGYFSWLQTTTSAPPWSNTELSKKLLSYATQNVSAAFEFGQELNQANNLRDVVKIQVEFMSTQLNSFNEQAKDIGGIYAKATECILIAASAAFKTAEAAIKMHSIMSN